jgi:hypothetical protein
MKQSTMKCMAVICVTVFLVSCGNKSDKAKEEKTPTDTAKAAVTEPPAPAPGELKLVCKDMGVDSMDIPHFNVMLVKDGKETKIKTVNGCGEITKEEYKTYDIPAEAIAACGGWYAGAGDYYYITMLNGKPSVFEGWQDETQKEKGYHWKEITVK